MKRITFLIAFLLSFMGSYAQVADYLFAQSTGNTYSAITGGTAVVTCNACTTTYDTNSYVIALPTTFTFNGVSISSVVMRVDGSLVVGATATSGSAAPLSAATVATGVISPLGMDLRNSLVAGAVYELRWEELTSEYVFQWSNASRYGQLEKLNFQIRVNKTTGIISVAYGDMLTIGDSVGYQPQVGLRGATNADYNNRLLTATVPDASPSWTDTAAGTANNSTVRFTAGTPAAAPFSGLTYTWTPQMACSGTPMGGTIAGTADRTLCPAAAIGALNVAGASSVGTTFQWEQSIDGGITWTNVTGGTGDTTRSYTPAVFDGTSVKYRLKVTCTSSTEFAYSSIVTINAVAAPVTQATALTATVASPTSISLAWTVGTGTRRVVVVSNDPIIDLADESGAAAYTASAAFADNGQQIVYDGTGTTVNVTGLICNTQYYIKVYDYNRCGTTTYDVYLNTSTGTNTATVTPMPSMAAGLPVINNFTGFTGANLSAVVPGWYEQSITTVSGTAPSNQNPAGSTSAWTSSAVLGQTTAKINLYVATANAWIISPKIALTANSRLKFKAAITDYNNGAVDPARMTGTDDMVTVLVSVDGCGAEWTPIYTFDADTTQDLTNVLTDYTLPLNDYVGQTIQIAFQATDGPLDQLPDYDFHIGSIRIETTPECDVPVLEPIANITKNSATLSWIASTVGMPTGYEYVVSTTNVAPAGAGTASTGTLVEVTGLTPSTNYYVFVRTVCGDAFSSWTLSQSFTTLCNPGEILTANAGSVCGQGTVNLSATANSGAVINWYASATSVIALGTGSTFTTPSIDTTTDFYVSAGNVTPNTNTFVGAGAGTTETYSNPFYSLWSNNHTQHLITAQELTAAGITAGNINSVGLNVTAPGTLPMINLSVKIGATTATSMAAFATGTFATVYTNASYMPVTGVNTLTFTTPFNWDGVSNIIVEFCHGNGASSATMSRTVKSDTTPFVSTVKAHVSAATDGATICSNTTTNLLSYSVRPQFMFNGSALCQGPRQAVTATVTTAPAVQAITANNIICGGDTTTISATSANSDYTYSWMPGNLTGAVQTVSPVVSTIYTVTATDAVSSCTTTATVLITVNAQPTSIVVDDLAVCAGGVGTITATGGLILSDVVSDTFDAASANFTAAATTGTVSATVNNTYFSQGSGSVLLNTPSTGANVNYTLNNGVDLTGYASAQLTFSHIAAMEGTVTSWDVGYVEYSVDGGTTWAAFPTSSYAGSGTLITLQGTTTPVSGTVFSTKSYPDWIAQFTGTTSTPGTGPAASLWKNETINVPAAALASTDFKVRFRYTTDVSANYYGWLIDNLKITGQSSNIVWTPSAGLFTDASATTPYTGQSLATVYVQPTAATTYTATSANTITGCSRTAEVDVTVTTTPAPTGTGVVTFTQVSQVDDLSATGTDIQWYAAATGGTPLAASTTLVNGATYYASQTANGCESAARYAVVVTLDLPVMDYVNLQFPGTLTIAAGTTGTVYAQGYEAGVTEAPGAGTGVAAWIGVNASNTDPSTWTTWIPATFNVQAGNNDEFMAEIGAGLTAGTYYYASRFQLVDGPYSYGGYNAEGGNFWNGTTSVSGVLTVTCTTAAPVAAASQTFCNSGTVAGLVATGENGSTFTWYADATGGAALSASTVLTNGGVYYASQTLAGGCEGIARTMVTATINTVAAPVAAASQTVCNSGTVADLNAVAGAGATVTWYTAASGGTIVPATTALTNGGVYYAAAMSENCESATRTMVTATVNTVAAPVAAASQTVCNSGTVADLNAVAGAGATVTWYTAATEGTVVPAATVLTNGGVYYAAAVSGTCESTTRTMVTATINTVAAPVADASQTFCNSGTVANLTATGGAGATITWYADATGGTALTGSTVLTNGGVYYASAMSNNCESATRTMVTATVNVVAAPVAAASQTFCNSGTVADLTAVAGAGATVTWYSSATGGTVIDASAALTNGGVYYAAAISGTCESETRTMVTATVNTVAAPVAAASQSFCNSGTVANLNAAAGAGATVTWYTDATGGTAVDASTALTNGGVYYAGAIAGTCESTTRTMVTVTLTDGGTITGEASQTVTADSGADATIEDIVITSSGTVAWYASEADAMAGTNALAMGTELESGNTYYAVQTVGECTSAPFAVTVTVVLGTKGFDSKAFTYYPNPVKDVLNFDYSSDITSVAVFNLLGQQVIAKDINAAQGSVNMSNLADGTYIVNVTAGNSVKTIKVIKKQ